MPRKSTEDERAIMAEGALVFGAWADRKPLNVTLSLAMSLAMRLAARLGVAEDKLIDFMRKHYRDAVKARECQVALGDDAATLIDGENRIILPGEQPL